LSGRGSWTRRRRCRKWDGNLSCTARTHGVCRICVVSCVFEHPLRSFKGITPFALCPRCPFHAVENSAPQIPAVMLCATADVRSRSGINTASTLMDTGGQVGGGKSSPPTVWCSRRRYMYVGQDDPNRYIAWSFLFPSRSTSLLCSLAAFVHCYIAPLLPYSLAPMLPWFIAPSLPESRVVAC
jgi:hypothetical protein